MKMKTCRDWAIELGIAVNTDFPTVIIVVLVLLLLLLLQFKKVARQKYGRELQVLGLVDDSLRLLT